METKISKVNLDSKELNDIKDNMNEFLSKNPVVTYWNIKYTRKNYNTRIMNIIIKITEYTLKSFSQFYLVEKK